MPFITLPTKARKSILSHRLLNSLEENSKHIGRLQGYQHEPNGEHNDTNVHRGVSEVTCTAGAYASTCDLNIVGITKNGTGDVTVELDSAQFTNDRIAIKVTTKGGSLKPTEGFAYPVDATHVRVRLMQLTSALGAGNAWAAVDTGFSLFANTTPFISSASLLTDTNAFVRGNTLGVDAGGFNNLLSNILTRRKTLLVSHAADGKHAAVEVSKGYVRALWGGASYASANKSASITSINRTGAGVVEVNLDAAYFTAQPFPLLLSSESASGDLYSMSAVETSATKVTVYLYKYDFGAKTWSRADASFNAVLHAA